MKRFINSEPKQELARIRSTATRIFWALRDVRKWSLAMMKRHL